MNPHRSPAEPCPDCEARARALDKFEPFTEGKQVHGGSYAWYPCPACGAWAGHFEYAFVCAGEGVEFSKRTGWLRRRTPAFVCDDNGANHFHMTCSACHHRWEMLTKFEQEIEDQDREDDDEEEETTARPPNAVPT